VVGRHVVGLNGPTQIAVAAMERDQRRHGVKAGCNGLDMGVTVPAMDVCGGAGGCAGLLRSRNEIR